MEAEEGGLLVGVVAEAQDRVVARGRLDGQLQGRVPLGLGALPEVDPDQEGPHPLVTGVGPGHRLEGHLGAVEIAVAEQALGQAVELHRIDGGQRGQVAGGRRHHRGHRSRRRRHRHQSRQRRGGHRPHPARPRGGNHQRVHVEAVGYAEQDRRRREAAMPV